MTCTSASRSPATQTLGRGRHRPGRRRRPRPDSRGLTSRRRPMHRERPSAAPNRPQSPSGAPLAGSPIPIRRPHWLAILSVGGVLDKPLDDRRAAPSLSRNSYRTQTLSRRCPRALWFGVRILLLGEWTASRASCGPYPAWLLGPRFSALEYNNHGARALGTVCLLPTPP